MGQVKQRKHEPAEKVAEKWSYALKEKFLRFFGDIKMFGNQPRSFAISNLLSTLFCGRTLLHDPRTYLVKGGDMRKAMADLQPGDILVRGFVDYLDGRFIPGFFSHVGLYLGRVDEETVRKHWKTAIPGCIVADKGYAPVEEVLAKIWEEKAAGEQMVIHSMKDGIFMEDLLNFCRCDYMVAVRFPDSVSRAGHVMQVHADKPEISKVFTAEEREIAERLKNNKSMHLAEIFPVMFKLALSQLGKEYDFGLDFSSFKKMSCTEFVYYCTKSLEWCSGVHPVDEKVFFIVAPGISPDGFAGSRGLDVCFESESVVRKDIMKEIRSRYPGPYGDFSR